MGGKPRVAAEDAADEITEDDAADVAEVTSDADDDEGDAGEQKKPARKARGGDGPPKKPPRRKKGAAGDDGGGGGHQIDASLMTEARRRYLNYALSVITSRALPDVRDGLKPVQRRILYAMFNDERIYPDAKHRKSATVVGAVLGRYHPHGDLSVYDAMVRMAQSFSLRLPLVDGSGNFGSLDGDGAAAYRYTECRLTPAAMELLRELRQATVMFRPNYDGTTEEPVVLPARFPNLLVNGSTGIAVGMATNIPPHNLREVCDALIALVDNREMTTTNILKFIQGPDFPTGGVLLNSKVELRQIYDSGSGPIKVRGEYDEEKGDKNSKRIVVTSIPYGVTKATIVEQIAEVIIQRKMPQLVDVRDESTDDVRIVLELKKDASTELVMAYLFKNTPLELNFNVNLTCLLPTESEIGQPQRLGIKGMLEHFLDFRYDTTRKRFEFDLSELRKRIHILEGFVVIFDALDETIKIIRKSDGRKDAAEKLMARFGLDQLQVDTILDLRLYKLARLEINLIREELEEKTTEAARIEAILKSKAKLWGVVKTELEEVATQYSNPRRTKTGGAKEVVEFTEDAFIVDEDAHVVLTRDGWIKRVREVKDPASTRLREGDAVMAILAGSTREMVVFFTNQGSAYVTRINDVPATTGYGDPVQKLFKFKDGERVVAALSLDARLPIPEELLAVSARGFGLRFALEPHKEVSTRAGRRYARPAKGGDEIIGVSAVGDKDIIVVATRKGHHLVCKAEEVNRLEGPGKGVRIIKVGEGDAVIGFVAGGKKDVLTLETEKGSRKFNLAAEAKQVTARGGKGKQLIKRGELVLSEPTVEIPSLGEEQEE